MATMIQIRNVPDAVHRKVKARAALAGTSMSEYLLREIERTLTRPSREEVLANIARLPEVKPDPPPAEILHEERTRR